MTKKANTILFIIAATLFNIITFLAVFLVLFLLLSMFSQKMLSDEGFSSLITPMFIVIFILALVISFAIYRCALNFFMQKVDIEEKFESVISKPKK